MRWTIWEGGLGSQPSSKVSALLLPAILSMAGPQQCRNRNLTQSREWAPLYSFMYAHTHTHTHERAHTHTLTLTNPWAGNWTALQSSTRSCINTGTFKGTSDGTCCISLPKVHWNNIMICAIKSAQQEPAISFTFIQIPLLYIQILKMTLLYWFL